MIALVSYCTQYLKMSKNITPRTTMRKRYLRVLLAKKTRQLWSSKFLKKLDQWLFEMR